MNNNIYSRNTNNLIKNIEKDFTNAMIRDTAKFQNKYGFELENGSAWNNEADAFKHAYMQAYLTLKTKYDKVSERQLDAINPYLSQYFLYKSGRRSLVRFNCSSYLYSDIRA